MGDYQRLHTDAEAAEVVPPIEPKIPRPFWHKTLFLFSISFTIAVIIFFLWGLPCDIEVCTNQQHSISWDKTLYNLELKGRMHLVGGHLVSILRAPLWSKASESPGCPSPHKGGVIALSAATGDTVWYVCLHITPIHIDCTLVGNRRCLVMGDNGFLMAIDYVSGLQSWRMRSTNLSAWPQPEEIDFPLTIPNRAELISLSRFKSGHHRLLFVSMETGIITSEPLLDSECYHVYNLTYSLEEGVLHYACATRLGGSRILSYNLGKSKNVGKAPKEPIDYSKKSKEDALLGEQKIIVTNKGSCPKKCQVSITVTDPTNVTVWTYGAERTYAMAPLPLRFRPHITGFLIKLWHWHDPVFKSSNGVTVEMIKERIVLITFNKSGYMHVVNASQTDITQLCYIGTNECQPQLSFQTQSALLVDVNGDGRQDLISYFVTYRPVNEEDHNLERVKDWELQSKVRVVRLEAELPKLYDAVSKN